MKLLAYLKLQYYYWKLYTRHLTDDDEWRVTPSMLTDLKKCLQVIPEEHYKRLSRKALQSIFVESYAGSFERWRTKCEEAISLLETRQDFPSSWSVGAISDNLTLMVYLSCNAKWNDPKYAICETLRLLRLLIAHTSEQPEHMVSYLQLKTSKLVFEGLRFLTVLLIDYKENQWQQTKRGGL